MKKILFLLFQFVVVTSYAKAPSPTNSYNYIRGIECLQKEDYDGAIGHFNKEVSDNPKNGYAYCFLSAIYQKLNEYGKALSNADLSLTYLPKTDKQNICNMYSVRASIYAALADTAKAIADYTSAINIDPLYNRGYENRGQIYYEQKNYELSDKDFKQITANDPSSVLGYMGVGRNYSDQNKWDEALEQFAHVKKLYPYYSTVYGFSAEANMGKKDWDKATDDIVNAIALDANNGKVAKLLKKMDPSAITRLRIKFQLQSAQNPNSTTWPLYNAALHEYNGLYKQAIKYYEETYRIDPSATYCLDRIAECYGKDGQYENSLRTIDRALSADSDNVSLMTHKANYLYCLGRREESISLLDSALKKQPDYSTGYYERGWAKMNNGDRQGAIEDFSIAVQIDPNNVGSYMARGDMYCKIGKNDLAKADYQKVIELEAKMDEFANSPYAHLAFGDTAKAIALGKDIIAKDSTKDVAYYSMACLYARMNRSAEALSYLEKSFQKGNKDFAHINVDYDMDPIRDLPEFKALVEKYKNLAREDDIFASFYGNKSPGEVVEIPFTKERGSNLCNVKCSINGLPLSFIFDTGASIVSLSQVEATFMMKNGYLSKSDVVGDSYFVDANGIVNVGTVINLKKVNFGGLELTNVQASVVNNQMAPLLLGQSVFARLGKIEIDNNKKVLRVTIGSGENK